MIIVRPDQIEEFANRLSTDVTLKARERTDIKTWVLANCVGMSNEQIVTKLALPMMIPNPVPQGTVTIRTRDEALRKLYRAGAITQAQLIEVETETIPDPNWQPTITLPSPLDSLGFGQGAVISLTEVEKVMV